ncbi:MAG: Fe-S cluster assembly protein SufD [Anaerolinea sp.]|nr:Fe-S cluster assembly protein SufD [Anaerolinea sp.]
MSSAVDVTAIEEQSQRIAAEMGDQPWLAALRAEGVRLAGQLSMPDSRRERPWKYLDISGLQLGDYSPAAGKLTLSGATAGVSVANLANGGATIQATAEKHLGKSVTPGRSRLDALHYAFLRDAVVVEVAASTEVPEAIRISREYSTEKQLATPHTLVVTGANSRVTVIDEFRSNSADIVALPAVEVVPGPGAEVRYIVLHRWGAKTQVFSDQRLASERDSSFWNLNLVTGGRVVKGHIESSLEGRGSSSELLGVCSGDDSEHVDFYTLQDHIGADTRSDLLFKAALDDHARSVYYGLTRIGLGARNGDANQENRNLLLSKTAKADSDPVLEILTNDIIRASHGATAGPVDEEQMYYLQTRGIPHDAAEALLVRAFLGQVLSRVPDEALRAEFEAILDEKLERR